MKKIEHDTDLQVLPLFGKAMFRLNFFIKRVGRRRLKPKYDRKSFFSLKRHLCSVSVSIDILKRS